jgi:hypothetical protein
VRMTIRANCAPAETTSTVEKSPDTSSGNGATGKPAAVPTILEYKEGGVQSSFATSTKLAMAIPWRRVKKGSFLALKLEGVFRNT